MRWEPSLSVKGQECVVLDGQPLARLHVESRLFVSEYAACLAVMMSTTKSDSAARVEYIAKALASILCRDATAIHSASMQVQMTEPRRQ